MPPRGENAVRWEGDVAFLDVATPKHPAAIARIDAADLVMAVEGGRWFACNFDGQIVYAIKTIHRRGQRKVCHRTHRVILGVTDPDELIDHADGDGLNNRRLNLRQASRTQNAANSRLRTTNGTGFRGVSQCPRTGRYHAQITVERRAIFLGYWDDAAMAAAAYDGAARALFGPYAQMNFREKRR